MMLAQTDISYVLDLLDPKERGACLTADERNSAINLISNKIVKNPYFIGKVEEV